MYEEYNNGMKNKVATEKVQKSESSADEIKRYLGALAEDFQGRVSAIAEQFLGLNEKLDNHTQMFVEINVRLDGMDGRLDGIDVRLDKVDGILDTHTQMIGQLMVDVQEIKIDLKQKVDKSEFVPLEKRVTALEVRPRAIA